MLTCSIGRISGAIIRKSLSGLTFVELNVPISTYSDFKKFDVTIDSLKRTFATSGCEVRMQEGAKTMLHITGMLDSQCHWMDAKPASLDSADVAGYLETLQISNGPHVQTSFINLSLTKGQLAIALANMSSKTAFIDFEKNTAVYYSDLYKKKPIQVTGIFSRMYTRPPMAGYLGWDDGYTANFPRDAQVILPFGQFTNTESVVMENLAENCNSISRIFSDMQSFTASHTCELGDTVISNLTHDKKIIVAAEEHYDENDCVTAIYYCV